MNKIFIVTSILLSGCISSGSMEETFRKCSDFCESNKRGDCVGVIESIEKTRGRMSNTSTQHLRLASPVFVCDMEPPSIDFAPEEPNVH